jgi:hypothetical protein
MANERATMGGPGLITRTASNALLFHSTTTWGCTGSATGGARFGVAALVESLSELHAANVPDTATPAPRFKKSLRFIARPFLIIVNIDCRENALLKTDFIYLNRGYQCVGMAVMPLERWSNPFAQTYLSLVQSTINAMSRRLTIESGFITTKSGLYDLILPTGKGRKADAGSRQCCVKSWPGFRNRNCFAGQNEAVSPTLPLRPDVRLTKCE